MSDVLTGYPGAAGSGLYEFSLFVLNHQLQPVELMPDDVRFWSSRDVTPFKVPQQTLFPGAELIEGENITQRPLPHAVRNLGKGFARCIAHFSCNTACRLIGPAF